MSGATNFRDLLRVSDDTVERPRALGAGHYLGTITNFEFGLSGQKKTPFVRLLISPTEETDDVMEGVNEGLTLANQELRQDFYLTPKSTYRLGDMLNAVLGKDSRFYDERLPEVRGVRILFGVTRRDVVDEATGEVTRTFNDITTMVAAP